MREITSIITRHVTLQFLTDLDYNDSFVEVRYRIVSDRGVQTQIAIGRINLTDPATAKYTINGRHVTRDEYEAWITNFNNLRN